MMAAWLPSLMITLSTSSACNSIQYRCLFVDGLDCTPIHPTGRQDVSGGGQRAQCSECQHGADAGPAPHVPDMPAQAQGHPSPITHHTSPITHHSSNIKHHPSHITHHPSLIKHHPSLIKHHSQRHNPRQLPQSLLLHNR